MGPLASADTGPAAASARPPLPTVSPTPQSIARVDADIVVTGRAVIVADAGTDPAARERLVRELRAHGVRRVDTVAPGARSAPGLLTVRLGAASRPDIASGLGDTPVPGQGEGYALQVTSHGPHKEVALGGADAAGQFYAVQTLRQLFVRSAEGWRLAGARVSDHPAMPLRGTIEGFYGQPWSAAERLDQMDFYGDVKANTYIYAPKDDPYHREQWRQPYPADKLTELGALIDRANANHVRFTFAVSPGQSICYSDASDLAALKTKLQAVYDLGARAFSIPLDDISYTRWNCAADQAAFGAPGRTAAAEAQVALLNDVQRTFVATHPGTRPLQMVPTEYGDLTDTTYKQTLRAALDPDVVVMWTGTDVVPPAITNQQADAASTLFGRKVFVWDNYPVNDFGATSGRLLLAPYDKREPGLSDHLSGVVANPMNQPYASKIAVFGAAGFAWNDRAYDAGTNGRQALSYLAAGDPTATNALAVFTDLEHLAPTFGAKPWQPQAPRLASLFTRFWDRWNAGERTAALSDLRSYAVAIADSPAQIRAGSVQAGFVVDAKPWLDATDLWGRALVSMVDALAARVDGETERSQSLLSSARTLAQQAAAVRVEPARNRWGAAPVKVADGVLNTFLGTAGGILDQWDDAGRSDITP
ncbi:beta-N-acetylglucosaminidase domain-containing protein [Streptomyces sp. NPDC048332]|uniref:beta-N-acetylhexosaminidase family protein n=1 Tax=Streptomyces sp. NPDC048332 TaxID=3154619 RepID=UPI003445A066